MAVTIFIFVILKLPNISWFDSLMFENLNEMNIFLITDFSLMIFKFFSNDFDLKLGSTSKAQENLYIYIYIFWKI